MLIIILLLVIYVAWKLYESVYYKSEKFLFIKNRIQTYILNCNELNHHIEELKNTFRVSNARLRELLPDDDIN